MEIFGSQYVNSEICVLIVVLEEFLVITVVGLGLKQARPMNTQISPQARNPTTLEVRIEGE